MRSFASQFGEASKLYLYTQAARMVLLAPLASYLLFAWHITAVKSFRVSLALSIILINSSSANTRRTSIYLYSFCI